MKKRRKQKERPEGYIPASTINWYPGHMAKALRQVKEKIKKVNLILEVRDARVPLTTGNPSLHEISGKKHRLIILNKVNLAEPEVIKKWEAWFLKQGEHFIFLNSFDKESVIKLLHKARKIVQDQREIDSNNTNLRMMIIGLPNTGKSTIINHLAAKKATKAADKPGLTQQQQWVNIAKGVDLIDTPGIMPPRIDTDEQGYWLCSIHAIKDEIVGEDTVAFFIINHLLKHSQKYLIEFYKIDELKETPNEVIEQIAVLRNFIRQKGLLDLDRAYKTILQDFRKGSLGPCSFEYPPED